MVYVEQASGFEDKDFSKIFKMGIIKELTFFLGLRINQIKEGIVINQSKYPNDILTEFGMDSTKPCDTLMRSSTKIEKDIGIYFKEKRFRGVIFSLLYLTESRPDIMLSLCWCARRLRTLKVQ